MTREVIFEKKTNDGWLPTHSNDLNPGDITRLKTMDGEVLGEAKVAAKNTTDPDSHVSFDLALDWMS